MLSDLIWGRWLLPERTSISVYVPDGYELVENEAHKKSRLERELQEKKKSLEYTEKKLAELQAQIAEEEKELLALG